MDTFISSIYQVDFIADDNGASTRLLSIGDGSDATLEFGFQQESASWAPLGQAYGYATALGGSRRALEWQRLVEHDSHIIAAAHAIKHPASLPMMKPGKLRVTIDGGEVWDLLDALILGASTRPHVGMRCRTMTGYRCEVGKPVPVSGLTHESGVRMDWILETHAGMGATLHSAA